MFNRSRNYRQVFAWFVLIDEAEPRSISYLAPNDIPPPKFVRDYPRSENGFTERFYEMAVLHNTPSGEYVIYQEVKFVSETVLSGEGLESA